jgi:O-antigen/teichoic acid export membrane protein
VRHTKGQSHRHSPGAPQINLVHDSEVPDLKRRTIRAGLARLCAQGAGLLLRMVSIVVLARLLRPSDFGLVGMVTAFTGVLTLIRDFGLSAAAVQRSSITEEQISTLFWINMLAGVLMSLVTAAIAPAIAHFYRQPQLYWITLIVSVAFIFNAAGVQHSALLQRQMRFTTWSVINVVSNVVGYVLAVAGAVAGYGYWALVAMPLATPFVATIGFWLTAAWVPGMPRKSAEVRSMLHFGSTVTLSGLVGYVAYNADKVMIGRAWGADALGLYGRAYQLISIPTDCLHAGMADVVFSVLSRLQREPARLRSYFLKAFSVTLGLAMPIVVICALFANDLVLVLLGPKWKGSVEIVRLLAPTIAILAIMRPLTWLIDAVGLAARGLKITLVFAPITMTGYFIGLPYGPAGVAIAYSTVMSLWVIPYVLWCVQGTVVSARDILQTASGPLVCGVLAGGVAYAAGVICGPSVSPLARLALESSTLFVAFFGTLLFVAGQRSLYVELLHGVRGADRAAQVPTGAN